MVFSKLDAHDEALDYFHNAVAVCKDLGDPLSLIALYRSIARIQYDKEDYEAAIAYF
jgi:hypothetical protein